MIDSISNKIELLDTLDQVIKKFGTKEIWWRGQGNSEWGLMPSIYRRDDPVNMETEFTNTFRRKALTRYPNCPPHGDISSWLFLMQHFQLPTKLLDWSQSILVATHFATSGEAEKPGALWALVPYMLNEEEFDQKIIFNPDGETMKPIFAHSFSDVNPKVEKVGAVWAKDIDVRITIQLSVFTIHGRREPLNELPNADSYLLKFEIPAEAKKRLFNFLDLLGIRESNLFPDLEHLANYMAKWEYEML